MRKNIIIAGIAILTSIFAVSTHAQGKILPAGIWDTGMGYIGVCFLRPENPNFDEEFTGFAFLGGTSYDILLNGGIRTFYASKDDVFTLNSIQSGTFTELNPYGDPNSPLKGEFYLAIYSGYPNYGNPEDPYFQDPLYGWALLNNDGKSVSLVDSALGYGADGIIVGTTVMVPEPGTLALWGLGAGLLTMCIRHRRS